MTLDFVELALEIRADDNVSADLLAGIGNGCGIPVSQRLPYLV